MIRNLRRWLIITIIVILASGMLLTTWSIHQQGKPPVCFEYGFGKNIGMGLFLAREILGITGITIRETGEPGKGALFEVRVPNGVWHTAEKDTGGS